ncbi:MAG TPA: NAD(P)H-hydrate dehydratase, partial [Paludibacter sp.]|nr:NAD(P)H-hydrate dehydratase [Paludibacter sp.]
PEIIFQPDAHSYYNTAAPQSAKYSAMAIGPGIGTHPDTAKMLRELLQETGKPCVLDADALNMLAMENDLLELIPKNSILTPHPKEFDRVFGHSPTSFHRLMKAQEAAIRYGVIIVLKGAYTCIALPDATLHFNSTGNPGMATAGSGDVLTGILCGLLAQGYTPIAAAKLGVFLHGLAGDLALEKESEESLIAGDIIENIGRAYDFIKG